MIYYIVTEWTLQNSLEIHQNYLAYPTLEDAQRNANAFALEPQTLTVKILHVDQIDEFDCVRMKRGAER